MSPPRKPQAAFQSLRIIGEKAHKLLQRAKGLGKEGAPTAPPSSHGASQTLPRVTVFVTVSSVLRSAVAILGICFCVFLLYVLQDKIVLFLLAVFVAVILDPGIKLLGRARIPRGVAVVLQYAIALFLFVFLTVSLIPVLAEQIQQLGKFLNDWMNSFLHAPSIDLPLLSPEVNRRLTDLLKSSLATLGIDRFSDALQQMGRNLAVPAEGSLLFAARLAGSVLDFFVNLILVLVFAFFMQIEKEKIIAWIRSFLPWNVRLYVDDKSEMIHWKLAQWTRGQLLLCFSVAFLVFLALVILRMRYALTLGILAGFTELIPVVGIFIAAIPAVLIGLTQQGWLWAVMLVAIYYVIQWCESNVLVPLVMKRNIGLSPIVVLFAMLVGVSFPSLIHPVLGIMLSIPLTTILAIFMEDWKETRMRKR